MRNYIFALMIGLSVAASVPVGKAQTPGLECCFEACSKSWEVSVVIAVNNVPGYLNLLQCYDEAVRDWETAKDIASDNLLANQRTVAIVGGGTWAGCRVGFLKFESLVDLLKKVSKKFVPYYCEIKAVAAAAVVEYYAIDDYWKEMNKACKEHDNAVEDCVKRLDPNAKEDDL